MTSADIEAAIESMTINKLKEAVRKEMQIPDEQVRQFANDEQPNLSYIGVWQRAYRHFQAEQAKKKPRA
jgi:hypothetical protein